MRFHYGQPAFADFNLLLQQMPDAEFSRGLVRSTIPLLAYWRNSENAVSVICNKVFGLATPPEGDVCFEFPVPCGGRGKASFTDVMFLNNELAFGIEGKSTEGMYIPVNRWLAEGKNVRNRQMVLRHWLDLIQSRTGVDIQPLASNLVYQMVHRTASVCSLNRRRCAIVYQVFDTGATQLPKYEEELRIFAQTIGANGKIGVALHQVRTQPTSEYESLKRRLTAALPCERAFLLRSAVGEKKLFEFEEKMILIAAPF